VLSIELTNPRAGTANLLLDKWSAGFNMLSFPTRITDKPMNAMRNTLLFPALLLELHGISVAGGERLF